MYRYLSTSRGDGNLKSNLLFTFAVFLSIATYLPREGTETSSIRSYFRRAFCIATYLPREGTETNSKLMRIFIVSGIATYLPREGPETVQYQQYCSMFVFVYLPIYLARGRKPNCPRWEVAVSVNVYSYLSTSRGAGNCRLYGARPACLSCIDTYLPREGPETQQRDHRELRC